MLNGQATSNDGVTILNRRVALINGAKISDDTYRYQISKVVTSNTDTTPDVIFNKLLAEITLDQRICSWMSIRLIKIPILSVGRSPISLPASVTKLCKRLI